MTAVVIVMIKTTTMMMVMLTTMITMKMMIKMTPTVTVMVIATTMTMHIHSDTDGGLHGVVLCDKHMELWNPLWNSLHIFWYASVCVGAWHRPVAMSAGNLLELAHSVRCCLVPCCKAVLWSGAERLPIEGRGCDGLARGVLVATALTLSL